MREIEWDRLCFRLRNWTFWISLHEWISSELQSNDQWLLHPASHWFPPFQIPVLQLVFAYFSCVIFCISKAADERSRWFVVGPVSAPLSPLSDHLHLLLSIAAQLQSWCAHWTVAHARDWQCANYASLHVPIKRNLKVIKQLFLVVQVLERPLWQE